MTYRHGGNINDLSEQAGCRAEELMDFSANINPAGPPAYLKAVVRRELESIIHYPDPYSEKLCLAIAAHWNVSPDRVVCGNGSTELLYALPLALKMNRVVIPGPAYIDYQAAFSKADADIVTVFMDPGTGFTPDWKALARHFKGGDAVIIGQPQNPTGVLSDPKLLLETAGRYPETRFIVDEAFADFVDGYGSLALHDRPNIIVLRSMTKFYAIPGLRLGYALMPRPLAANLRDYLPPWSVSNIAQAVGSAVLKDASYAQQSRETVSRLRNNFVARISEFKDIKVFPSAANYLLLRLETEKLGAAELAKRLLAKHHVAIRVCSNYEGLDNRYFRVAVKASEDNDRFVRALADVMGKSWANPVAAVHKKRPPPALMFQGTTSNAGKSVLCAAFCRILLQDGFRVAPFKAQNMSLNSHVTADGKEMGRAQVVQAQACRLAPDVRMNPVLLKPSSDTGAQVIVMGEPVGSKDVAGYIDYKARVWKTVQNAYDDLSSAFDVMVLEGAGSPGEVNLMHHDIVNMTMAAHARAPVVIAGDIDRGGVFAHFIGTWEVLPQKDRDMVAGFLINRFRGDQALLGDAMDYVKNHTGADTLGIVPFIPDLGLPEEDSVSFKAGDAGRKVTSGDGLEVAVIDLPHISNFTDFDPFKIEPVVNLKVVRRSAELGTPDAVILPGSKNVLGDLAHLKQTGLAEAVAKLVRGKKTVLVGICGGFQMLGETIADPDRIESVKGEQAALGLLDLTTVMKPEKTLVSVAAAHVETGFPLTGYEIHHGKSTGRGLTPAVKRKDGEIIGYTARNNRVFGTYLHGIFDNDKFRRWFINDLRTKKGLAPETGPLTTFDIEPALNRLADVVRANVNLKAIYQKMGLS